MSLIRKPLSANIKSPATRCLNKPDFSTISLSEMEPGNSLLTYVMTAFGATPTITLKEFILR